MGMGAELANLAKCEGTHLIMCANCYAAMAACVTCISLCLGCAAQGALLAVGLRLLLALPHALPLAPLSSKSCKERQLAKPHRFAPLLQHLCADGGAVFLLTLNATWSSASPTYCLHCKQLSHISNGHRE